MNKTATLLVLSYLFVAGEGFAADCKKINALPYTISSPGQYCLEKDLSTSIASDVAIGIQADDVVVDLGGYNVTGTAGSTSNAVGIRGIDVHNVRITNGTVRGFRDGINLFFSASGGGQTQPTNHVIDHVTADNNTRYGIRSDGGGVIVRDSRVTNVVDPAGAFPGVQIGIELAGTQNVVENSTVANTAGSGVYVLSAAGVIQGNRLVDTAGLVAGPSSGPDAVAVYENQIVNSRARYGAVGIVTSAVGIVLCKDNMVANFADLTSVANPCTGADNLHVP